MQNENVASPLLGRVEDVEDIFYPFFSLFFPSFFLSFFLCADNSFIELYIFFPCSQVHKKETDMVFNLISTAGLFKYVRPIS